MLTARPSFVLVYSLIASSMQAIADHITHALVTNTSLPID